MCLKPVFGAFTSLLSSSSPLPLSDFMTGIQNTNLSEERNPVRRNPQQILVFFMFEGRPCRGVFYARVHGTDLKSVQRWRCAERCVHADLKPITIRRSMSSSYSGGPGCGPAGCPQSLQSCCHSTWNAVKTASCHTSFSSLFTHHHYVGLVVYP